MDYRTPSGRYFRWDAIVAHLRSHPGWSVVLRDEPARLVKNVRQRSNPDLRLDDGEVEATLANRYKTELGTMRGDVYLRFVPHKKKAGASPE